MDAANRNLVAYLLSLSMNTTLAELSYRLIENYIYIRFPCYKDTGSYVQTCATKNTLFGEIMYRMIFTKKWIYIWMNWKYMCNSSLRNSWWLNTKRKEVLNRVSNNLVIRSNDFEKIQKNEVEGMVGWNLKLLTIKIWEYFDCLCRTTKL